MPRKSADSHTGPTMSKVSGFPLPASVEEISAFQQQPRRILHADEVEYRTERCVLASSKLEGEAGEPTRMADAQWQQFAVSLQGVRAEPEDALGAVSSMCWYAS